MPGKIRRFAIHRVTDAVVSERLFVTEDDLGLSLTRFHRADCDDVVLLVHGLTGSRDTFLRPGQANLVSYLLDQGFTDVWALDSRMSRRLPYDLEPHRYTLDDVAAFDHPAALRSLRESVGDRRVHVIAHCLGSVTFLTALFSGLVDEVTSAVSNSVSLHPRLSRLAGAQMRLGLAPYGRPRGCYGSHVRKMAAAKRVVKWNEKDTRVPDVFADLTAVQTPILFLSGTENHVFADSNVVTHQVLEQAAPGRHELQLLPGYRHADPFTGRNAHTEVFPRIVEFLGQKAV